MMNNTHHDPLRAHQQPSPVQAMLTRFTILIERTLNAALNTALHLMLLQAPQPLRAGAAINDRQQLNARRVRS